MDKETLRKQLYEEIHSQFEAKLREAKRDRSQLEEDMESASEKWRSERRRLNSEIDRLEAKLVEARERKKASDVTPGKAADPQQIAKIQAAAEDRVAKASQAFEADRDRLQQEIVRLQSNIADLIERSNNPIRTTQAEKEKFETRLEDALKAKRLTDEAMLAGKAGWEQEKLKLLSEIAKLRGGSQEKAKARQDSEQLEQVQKQLKEALRLQHDLASDLERARQQGKTTQAQAEEFDAVKLQLEKSHKERANLEKQLQEASKYRAQAEANQAQTAQLADMAAQLEKSQKERANLERQLREATKQQEKLDRELDRVRQAPLVAKEAQSAEIERLKEELKSARVEVRTHLNLLDEMRATTSKERAALEKQIREATSQQEKLERDLDKLQHSRGVKDSDDSAEIARLKQALESANAEARLQTATNQQEHETELARLNAELHEARQSLQQQESAVPGTNETVRAEIVEQLRNQYDERMQEMIQQKTQLSEELRNITSLLEEERTKLATPEGKARDDRSDGIDHPAVNGEVERIQGMIAGIARVIDDPETELSTVIRKNVERAELDAYLKGILFSLGRGRGL